jgi:hypothetical protein
MSAETNKPTQLTWKQVAEFPEAKLRVIHISEESKQRIKLNKGDITNNDPGILKHVQFKAMVVKPILISLKDITDEHLKEFIKLEYGEGEEEITPEEIAEARKELTTANKMTNSNFPSLTIHEINFLKAHEYDVYWWKAQGLCEYKTA